MKKLGLMLLLLGNTAAADWTRVGGNEELDAYVDLATIHRQANLVDVRALFDYKSAHQWSDYLLYWSTRTQKQFDCDDRLVRTRESAFHFDHMGVGQSIYTVPGGATWRPVAPDSIDAVLRQFACKQEASPANGGQNSGSGSGGEAR
jgi:surface-adhesin protein E